MNITVDSAVDSLVPLHQVSLRDDGWLNRQLEHIWSSWFADVDRLNPIVIRFTRPWKRRLAVIYLSDDERTSFIGVNRLLRDVRVPYTVCLVAIAHELAHYVHGFGSHHARRYDHPHRGNVVQEELIRRGLDRELRFYEEWTDNCWFELHPSLQAGPEQTTGTVFLPDGNTMAAATVQ